MADRKESFRLLVVSVKIKTSVSSFAVCNNANTPNTEVSWPGVSRGLDKDENRKKPKESEKQSRLRTGIRKKISIINLVTFSFCNHVIVRLGCL